MIKLYPSFSGLLFLLNRGYDWKDSSNSLYMFGCSKEGIEPTLKVYNRGDQLAQKYILEMLAKAETENRCLWMQPTHGSTQRMGWLIAALRARGLEVKDFDPTCSESHDAWWNLPALRAWCLENVPSIIMCDNEFGINFTR